MKQVKYFMLMPALCATLAYLPSLPARAEAPSNFAAALPPGAPPNGFADVAEKLLPQVVNISTSQKAGAGTGSDQLNQMMDELPQLPPGSPFEKFFRDLQEQQKRYQEQMPDDMQRATSVGSGFIVDAAGYIVTNNHVVQDADEISVTLHDNTTLKAELVGTDKKTDLAVLKVKPEKALIAAKWGDSDKLRVGDWVLAIGNPYAFGGTVTAGIISARSRNIESGPYDDYIQSDAAINRGNSGGPMFNMQGEVIGVNTAIISPTGGSIGLGFAIPSALAKNVVEQLKTSGHTRRGWLGVRIQGVSQEIAESLGLGKPRGAMITSANNGGPAQKAGVQNGDVILSFDGKEVTEMRRLPRIVAEADVGKTVPLTVWRDGKEIELKVKLGELESAEKSEEKLAEGDKSQKDKTENKETKAAGEAVSNTGLTLANLDDSARKKYNLKSDVKGLLVLEVKSGSKAAERGLRAGDVIMEIGQQEVTSPAEVTQAVKTAKERNKPLLLLVQRDGDARFVALPINEDALKDPNKKVK